MNKPRPTILKIGGSVITDKSGELAAKTSEIDRLAKEIREANVQNLVVIHGGGSFGHPSAEKYAIKDGYKEKSQKIGFSETHHFMTVLNGLLMDSLILHDVAAVSITPSSCIITENGRIKHFEDSPLRALLQIGFMPILYGDAVMDTKMGFTILSGDQIASAIAIRFGAERIIMGADVDGVYSADPKLEKKATMFERLTLNELKKFQSKIGRATACDVTGGMLGKITELIPAVETDISVTIVNATEPGLIQKALRGEVVRGTMVEKG